MEGMEALDQLALMREGINYRFPVSVRRFKVYLRPLSNTEETNVITAVLEELRSIPEDKLNPLDESRYMAMEKLQLASTSDEGKTDYKLTKALMAKWTPDEIQHVFTQYTQGLELCNPALEEMTTDQVKELVESVKKNHLALTDCTTLQLRKMVEYFLTSDESPLGS